MTGADATVANSTPNILLVDDQPADLMALEAVLERLGQRLVKARSGVEALRRLLDEDFAVVLLDIHMYGLDGFATARLIRERERSRHTPIIFLTAYPGPDFPVVEAYQLGAVDYLIKPVIPEILRAKVAGFVDLFQATEQVKRQAEQLRQLQRREFERQAEAERTRRAALEEALRVSRQRLDLVLGSVGLGLWYCDLPLDRLVWNDHCKEHFGLPAGAEVTIHTFYERLHPEDRPATREAIERSLADGSGYDIVYRTVAPDGRVRWIRAIGHCFRDSNGKPDRFDGITVDVTAQQQAEEALRAADRRKDEFLLTLAHELRNPLAPILTGLYIARQPQTDVPTRERVLAAAERQTRHVARLVDDLVDVSRITHGRVELRRENLDLAGLVRTTAEDQRFTVERAGLAFEVATPATPVWVEGDATRLVQILNNLLDNAVKFTERGGRVAVRLARAEDGRQALVSVRDTGIGIKAEDLPHLFGVFTQGDRSLDRRRGGLGLGLTAVKGLVDLHGGTVEAASAGPGQGAEFAVRLPLTPG
jgi:PAS domain S-box-containing protein